MRITQAGLAPLKMEPKERHFCRWNRITFFSSVFQRMITDRGPLQWRTSSYFMTAMALPTERSFPFLMAFAATWHFCCCRATFRLLNVTSNHYRAPPPWSRFDLFTSVIFLFIGIVVTTSVTASPKIFLKSIWHLWLHLSQKHRNCRCTLHKPLMLF